ERKKNSPWILNGKDEVRPEYLKLLLDCFYRISIRTKVARSAYNNVVKALASTGIKCEVYLNDNVTPEKIFYVGGQTEDGLGTFMILENSDTPFITEIPGFNGYLTPRFSTDYDAWKQPRLFKLDPAQLKNLSISYSNF